MQKTEARMGKPLGRKRIYLVQKVGRVDLQTGQSPYWLSL